MNLDDIYGILSNNGYKLTKQRKILLDIFIKYPDIFLSAEDIQKKAKDKKIHLDLSTIYRTINIFDNVNLICKTIKDGSNLYKIRTTKKHHHHLICKKCGKAVSFDFCPSDIFNRIAEKNGFVLAEDKIELYGYCNKCSNTL